MVRVGPPVSCAVQHNNLNLPVKKIIARASYIRRKTVELAMHATDTVAKHSTRGDIYLVQVDMRGSSCLVDLSEAV